MRAREIMNSAVVTARSDECLRHLLSRMRKAHLRMLPVVDAEQRVQGVISTLSIMEHLLPSYVTSGDLGDISFAPDIGIMREYLNRQMEARVTELMDEALLVDPEDAVLAVAAALIRDGHHECAVVADAERRLLGVISAGDVLAGLTRAGIGVDD